MPKKLLCMIFAVYAFSSFASDDQANSAGSQSVNDKETSGAYSPKQEERALKDLIRGAIRKFIDGFELHVEVPRLVAYPGFVGLKASPAWFSYYAAIGKTLKSYVDLKKAKQAGIVDPEIMHRPMLEDAESSPRVKALQEKFRVILRERGHALSNKLRVFVGLSSYPFLVFCDPLHGVIFCDRDFWYKDEELVEIVMLHELGHLIDPVNAHWHAETQALLPAFVVACVGFGALQLMHHKSVRGMVEHPLTAGLGVWLLGLQNILFRKAIFGYRGELYADTFAAENIKNPAAIAKLIEWLEEFEEDFRPFYYKIPGFDALAKRFYLGYPSRARRKANLQKIMERRLQEQAEQEESALVQEAA